jgi:ABC-type lipoprotein export system ATPase subunit
MNSVLRAEGLHKTYYLKNETIDVLRGIDLAVGPGDFVVILGPSGSGKSTLLNILGSLDRPTRGRIMFEGADLFRHSDDELSALRNRRLGFIFQFHHLLSEFTARENIALPCLEAGFKPREAHDRADGLLAKFGMAGKEKRFPDELSGGERQRVAVARALVNDPSLLLADEPTGNLDEANTAKLLEAFSRLKEEGRTIILVTHSLDIARLGTNVYNLREGKLL